LAAVAAGLLAASCGKWELSFESADFKESRRLEVPHVVGSRLRVRTENGGVVVDTAPGPSVVVVADLFATTAERLAAAKVVSVREGNGTLSFDVEWPSGRRPSEGCAFRVTVPDAKGVVVESSNGAIEVRGDAIVGGARLETSNGSVTVQTRNDAVVAHTHNGAVKVTGTHRTVEAESSNGAIEAVVGEGPARLKTSNGRVRLALGSAFKGAIDAETSNGAIETPGLEGRSDVTIDRPSKRRAHVVVGSGGEPSTIRTSNGSVVVSAGSK